MTLIHSKSSIVREGEAFTSNSFKQWMKAIGSRWAWDGDEGSIVTPPAADPTPKTPTSDQTKAPADQTQKTSETPWYDSLSEEEVAKDARAGLSKFKTPGALAKSYLELEKMRGQGLTLPGEGAKPEEWDAFFNKLGRPEKVDGYQLERPNLGGEGIYPADLEKSFLTKAHEAGLSNKQAQALLGWWGETEKATLQKLSDMTKANVDSLKKDWGTDYEDNIKAARATARQFLEGENQDLVTLLKTTGMDRHPAVIRFFHSLSKQLGEGQIVADDGGQKTDAIEQAKKDYAKSRAEYAGLTKEQKTIRSGEFADEWARLNGIIYGEAPKITEK
jgi:hypothetical protein